MKFLYEYRTPDNEKHPGVIHAADREAAYAELKRQGIKPCRFAEAPGLFNLLFGKGKRWMAIAVLSVLCVVLAVMVSVLNSSRSSSIDAALDSSTRRQLIGDAAVIEKGIRTGWSEVFAFEGERYLASYAIPGAAPAVVQTTKDELEKALSHVPSPESRSDASIEAKQIVSIVEGLKQELRDYLADGGALAKYARRLNRRQTEEIGYYERARREIEGAAKSGMSGKELEALWEDHNAQLRKLGIKLVRLPERER